MDRIGKTVVYSLLIPLIMTIWVVRTPAASGQLTLKEAVDQALKQNPSLRAAENAVEAADNQVRQARSRFFPRLDLTGTFTNGNNPVYAFGTRLGQQRFSAADFDIHALNHPDAINNFKGELTVYQSIWEGGKIRAQNRIARLNKEIQDRELAQARQHLIFNVVSHYFSVQLSQDNLDTAKASLKSSESSAGRIQNMFDNGLVVKSDLLRIQVYVADVNRQVLQAENELQLATAALGVDLGQREGFLFQPATPLRKIEANITDQQAFVDQALANRPEILKLKSAVEIARNQVREAKGEYLPGIGFFSTLEYNQGTVSDSSGGNYMLGVQVKLNLFDGFYKGSKVGEAKAHLMEMENQMKNLSNMVSLQVKDAFLKMRTAEQQYKVASLAVDQADEGLRIMKNRYDSGLATLTDLLNAETALTGARTNLSMAQYNYNLAYARLELAAGTLNENSRLLQ